MQMRTLGPNGPEISVVGYGAWEAGGDAWGPNESDDAVIRAIQAAADSGMTWIDTAEVYGAGRSEELVGRAITGRRDDVLLFTKVGPEPEGTGHRPGQVKQAIRKSLGRLGTDYVDLYQLHWPDERGVAVEETWQAMCELQDEGLTRHIGLSNYGLADIEKCLAIRHVDSLQNEFSLVSQDDRAELIPWLEERGIGYLAYGPLGYGLLTGAIKTDSQLDDWRMQRDGLERLFGPQERARQLEKVEKMRSVADGLGTTPAALALRWVVEQGRYVVAIAGSRNERHVRANADAGDLELPDDARRELDDIFA